MASKVPDLHPQRKENFFLLASNIKKSGDIENTKIDEMVRTVLEKKRNRQQFETDDPVEYYVPGF